ncbi:MAG: DUF3137 domain-containing protein [Prolixibacteraceae bacterium]|nr:DUF3137 domain-containing protein [Prolixibacteraceae bacterium]
MISKDKLSELYNNQLKQRLSDLEKNRKRVKTMQITTFIVLFISIIVLVVFAYPIEHSAHAKIIFSGLFLMVFIGVLFIFIDIKQERKYREYYKKEVFKEVIHAIKPDWRYEFDHCVLQDEYLNSNLFNHKYNLYQGGDYVEGQLGHAHIKCSELKTKYKTVDYDKNGKRLYVWHTIFNGLFLHAQTSQNIKGETHIIPVNLANDKIDSKLKNQNEINLNSENTDYKKAFKIYSTDEEQARAVITPQLLELLMKFYGKHKYPLYFSFTGSNIYCALSLKKDLFEPRIFKSLLNYNDVALVYHLFEMNEEVIKEVKKSLLSHG